MRGSREADFLPSSQPYVALTEVNIIDYFDNEVIFFANVGGAVKLLCVAICSQTPLMVHGCMPQPLLPPRSCMEPNLHALMMIYYTYVKLSMLIHLNLCCLFVCR